MSTKNRTRRTTTRNIRFPNQMIEQINIALDRKRKANAVCNTCSLQTKLELLLN
ncbi:Qin prophage [Escherichia coli]|nr:Qin prophage [Escherichia coli]